VLSADVDVADIPKTSFEILFNEAAAPICSSTASQEAPDDPLAPDVHSGKERLKSQREKAMSFEEEVERGRNLRRKGRLGIRAEEQCIVQTAVRGHATGGARAIQVP
jgi:hypothetical protein